MEYVLGVDIGTGSVKAVAVDADGKSFQVAQYHYSFSSIKPGYHEQDPDEIWEAFVASLKDIITKIGSQPLAISLSSAMHSLIAVSDTGMPLVPMITWADSRSLDIALRLKASAEGKEIYESTGTPLHAMSPLCKIIWLKENNPDLYQTTSKFISIKEYIWFKLFGVYEIDHSIASCTGLFDISNLQWYQKSLDLCEITSQNLSTPVPTNFIRNYSQQREEYNQQPGDRSPQQEDSRLRFLNDNTPFVIGASDGCLANLGSMANKPGIGVMTIGTSGAVRTASEKPIPNREAMTFNYILDSETFICGGPINNGGIALQWLIKNFHLPQSPTSAEQFELTSADYDRVFQQIDLVPPGSKGLIFLPYLTGERAPIWDSESCGNFFGVRLHHSVPEFSRAVLEGICYALNDVLKAVEQNTTPIKHINISGGFVKSATWVQMLADITGKDLVITQTADASAIGAAYLAMKTLGIFSEYPSMVVAESEIIKPNENNKAIYSKNFVIFKKLYSNLKETMHQLQDLSV